MFKINFYILLFLTAFVVLSCEKNEEKKSQVFFSFSQEVNNNPLIFDSIMYVNAAGNNFMITEIQYFVSDFTFWKDGKSYPFTSQKFIKYVDTNIPATLNWDFPEKLPVGSYDSLSFTFGIDSVKNQSNIFANPPERDMFWPEMMGGGYHYIKMNGKWIPEGQSQAQAFNLHIGIGQIYANDSSSTVVKFVQNYFKVVMTKHFQIFENSNYLAIVMDVNSWFDTPEVYNLDFWGAHIMQNQNAMHAICLNGKDAFSLRQFYKDK
ncbi:MAG: hypothetical protein M0R21_08505 [Lentimicrobiaceae bacterium]|nr:hypothetical protein [Lentimicrobiaceae bacterium]